MADTFLTPKPIKNDENIKLKIHEDENLKQLNKYREETIQLKTENAALDRQLYAMKSRPDSSQS